jgi:ArsR family transcriptional regulator
MKPDQMFRAFADETRLRVLQLLSSGELCVCDLMSALDAPQSKMSRHLAYLKRAGLVLDRKQGKWRHYSLAKPKTALHRGLLACLDKAPKLQRTRCK